MSKPHVIDGVTYVEVERQAKVGDKIIVLNSEWVPNSCVGNIYEVKTVKPDLIYTDGQYRDGSALNLWRKEYVVLEPTETVSPTQSSPSVTDLLANLARRVASLEQQLRDTQGNVEKLAEELANTKYRISKHVSTLDERSQVLNAINRFYEEGSR
jgi:septal ring factor EnvC (AmiA/AmiB activator)